LIEEEGKVVVKEAVSIIQHPNGEPKQLAIRENRVVDILPDFVHYQTDTAPGSSGSPVLNDQWEVVALHHSGVPKRDANGNILAIDGSIWKPSMGDQKIDWISNEGVRVSRIMADVKSHSLQSDAAGELRDTLFSADESTPLLPSASPSIATGDGGSVARLTIPLHISIQVGGAQFAPSASAEIPLTIPGSGQLPASGVPADDTDSELQAALAAARDARSKPYFEEERDKQDRDRYYSGIADNPAPADLYRSLSVLVRQTHKVKPRYQPALHVYPFVDLQPNRKLQSIYTQKEFEPEELIRAHFEIRREIARQVRETLLSESLDLTQMAERISLLEAAAQFNCEHVVPQSWFDKREPMRGDLHHLFACEPDCNSFRSNTPYCDFTDFGEAIRTNCGKSAIAADGDRGFEPGGGKGAVTRAIMYFLLRYPGEINNTGREFKASQLPTLVQWQKTFPPSLYEHHRNQAIFDVQGNRNPLIDFPEWVEKIDFQLGLG
jgi:endonuclease G, mitochondrial